MPVFNYSAKDETGQTISGQVIAPNERMAASQVRDLGFFPLKVDPGTMVRNGGVANAPPPYTNPNFGTSTSGQEQSATYNVGGASVFGETTRLGGRQFVGGDAALGTPFVRPYGSWFERAFIFPIWSGVKPTELALFYRQFAAMLGAGMTITGALTAMGQETNPTLRKACYHINRHVTAGGRLSEGLAMFPHIFTQMQREMIASSESTGGLDEVLIRMSTYIEAEAALKRMIKRETFQSKITFAGLFLLPNLVVAIMSGMQAYFNVAVLPLIHLLEAGLAIYVFGRYALKSEAIAIAYDTFKAYLPYFGTTVRMLAIAKFSRAFASLFAGGVLIPTAVGIAANTTGNAFLAWQMKKTVPYMMAGSGLTEAFKRTGVFPSMFLSMLGTGEQTGNLDQTLTKLAEYYEAESEIRLHQSVQTLNILIFLAIAVMVGIEVIKFYQGYFNGIFNMAGDGGGD